MGYAINDPDYSGWSVLFDGPAEISAQDGIYMLNCLALSGKTGKSWTTNPLFMRLKFTQSLIKHIPKSLFVRQLAVKLS